MYGVYHPMHSADAEALSSLAARQTQRGRSLRQVLAGNLLAKVDNCVCIFTAQKQYNGLCTSCAYSLHSLLFTKRFAAGRPAR